MGSGKSTIGRKLSSRLGVPLVDTDAEIEKMEGMSISEIFEQHGEEYFRLRERQMLEAAAQLNQPTIVSTGGGLPVWRDNMERMNELGLCVYLHRTAENIASRLSPRGREKRPKLRGLNDQELVEFMRCGIAERDAIYSKASLRIAAECYDDEAILDIIIAHINE